MRARGRGAWTFRGHGDHSSRHSKREPCAGRSRSVSRLRRSRGPTGRGGRHTQGRGCSPQGSVGRAVREPVERPGGGRGGERAAHELAVTSRHPSCKRWNGPRRRARRRAARDAGRRGREGEVRCEPAAPGPRRPGHPAGSQLPPRPPPGPFAPGTARGGRAAVQPGAPCAEPAGRRPRAGRHLAGGHHLDRQPPDRGRGEMPRVASGGAGGAGHRAPAAGCRRRACGGGGRAAPAGAAPARFRRPQGIPGLLAGGAGALARGGPGVAQRGARGAPRARRGHPGERGRGRARGGPGAGGRAGRRRVDAARSLTSPRRLATRAPWAAPVAPSPSGKARVCKIRIRRFESARCLHPPPPLQPAARWRGAICALTGGPGCPSRKGRARSLATPLPDREGHDGAGPFGFSSSSGARVPSAHLPRLARGRVRSTARRITPSRKRSVDRVSEPPAPSQ